LLLENDSATKLKQKLIFKIEAPYKRAAREAAFKDL
jgi:hypothetical protein